MSGPLKAAGRGYVRVDATIYRLRGPWTVDELNAQYSAWCARSSGEVSVKRWLVERGKVYFRKDPRR